MRAALAARDVGEPMRGILIIRQALELRASDPGLWQVLGLLYRHCEDSLQAIAAFDEAARLNPTNARIVHGQARVTSEAGRPSLAIFERALELAPADLDLHLSYAAALLGEQGPAAATAALDAVLNDNPGWIVGQRTRATLRWQAGDREGYTGGIDHAICADPQALPLWSEKINLLISAERHYAALQTIEKARSLIGNARPFDASEAIAASETGEHTRADILFAALAPIHEMPLSVRHMRHLLRTGRIRQAARLGESLIILPGAEQAWPYLALSWRLLGDPRWEWLERQPGLIGEYDLTGEIGPLDDLAAVLRSLHIAMSAPLGQSVRTGTQTDGPLFARVEPEIRRARAAIERAVGHHLAALPADQPAHPLLSRRTGSVRFAGSWSVRLTSGGCHTNHFHPEGLFSSALYVMVPAQDDAGPEPAGYLALGQPPAELGINLPPVRLIVPQPGKLVLFPSMMWHGTSPIQAGERLSIAFDVARA
jgi:tetratricopeptide (TPR) repeat protein